MLKIVIDTNLLIDGSSDDYNYGNRIIDEVLAGKLEAFANRPTLRENRFLAEKKISDADYLAKLGRYFETVKLVDLPEERLHVAEDKEDDKLLESAVAAQADFLVSSDRHLLDIGSYEGIRILPPGGFWAAYQEESGEGWEKWLKTFIE